MLSTIEKKRLHFSKETASEKKSQFGQFFTPQKTAVFMANLFPYAYESCHLLDAGAGIGSLSAAFLDRWTNGGFGFANVTVDAFEVDPTLIDYLSHTLEKYYRRGDFSFNIYQEDFIHVATQSILGSLFSEPLERYTHVIMNPPYRKISSASLYRKILRNVGIETVNLYSAFVSLAVALAAPGAQIVAIIPRSFCNGPYYRPFREFILERAAIRHIHLFESRRAAFKDDQVLQENVIIHLERGADQEQVTISTSTDDSFTDLATCRHSFDRIVYSGDPERFIHIPTTADQSALELLFNFEFNLTDIGINVSTGPVVEFRHREHLRDMPEPDTVPLLYPAHFTGGNTVWPIADSKRPNAILYSAETEKWLYPNGFYCVVRRFSSKEERHRIVASVVEPSAFGDSPMIGFENHLNVFHIDRRGLSEALARGLAVFLNSTVVDEYFRRFSGHTQVNATDLRLLQYPDAATLSRLGNWAAGQSELTQEQIDHQIKREASDRQQ